MVHDNLGMDVDYSEDGVAQFIMMKHLEKIFLAFLKKSEGPVPVPHQTICSKFEILRK
jgi:hypothetical protein